MIVYARKLLEHNLTQISLVLYVALIVAIPIKASLTNAVIVVTALCWVFAKGYKELSLTWQNSIVRYLVLFYLLLVLSLIYSSEQGHGVQFLFRRIPLVLIPLILPFFLKYVHQRHIVSTWVITWLSASFYSLASTIYVYGFNPENLSYFSWVLPNTIGIDSNYYSLFCSATLTILLNDFFIGKSLKTSSLIYFILILYFFTFLALLSSRTTFFSTSILILCAPLFFCFSKGISKRVGALYFGVGISIVLTVFWAIPYLKEKTFLLMSEKDPRYFQFQAGWNVVRCSPIFGVGIGDAQDHLMKQYEILGFREGIENKYNVHNEYLHTAISAGIPALATFLILLALCFKIALRNRNFAQFGFIIVFASGCLTEVVLNRFNGIAFFSILLATLFIKPFNETHSSR